MRGRKPRWEIGTIVWVATAVLVPGSALGVGPVRLADGQPENDVQLSVLTPAQEAFMAKKLTMAAAVGSVGSGAAKPVGKAVPTFACEFDPCESTPTWPPAGGPPASKLLLTKARQQDNWYYCGPASGQVVINWTRGIINGTDDGEATATNWRKQSKIAAWMGTTTAGTGGANLAAGLNNPSAVVKPTADWIYAYADIGTMHELYDKIVTDVAAFGMPLVLATAPHLSGAGVNFLESWPNVAPGAHHWIVIRGYEGLWGGSSPVIIRYQDSSAGYGGATGAFDDTISVVWQVSKWNQGGHVVW
jgi:hypothetical protein